MAQQTPTVPTTNHSASASRRTHGTSKSSIYAWMDPESPSFDPTFPKQVSIGPRAVGWVEAEQGRQVAARLNVAEETISRWRGQDQFRAS